MGPTDFNTKEIYLRTAVDAEVCNFRDWGIALGRRFRALKLWALLRTRLLAFGMVLGIAVRGIVGMCFVCLGTVMLCISMLLCVGMALTF